MANPKRRHSNTRTRLRRSHDFLVLRSLSKCSHCGAAVLPHRVCDACGYYRGKQVITLKVKDKKEKD
ncbi:MAG: 50S ribosomal protein L32 [Candidatus Omnitrophica bacterium]|nr:50S ribosomal protein L32 [Candidatus Omnitrophota bacterium]MDD5670650.1 50S ribosomal protein L32 [Candidatus Omnitrophota bacterium]